jgi:predicted RNA-binding protein with PUA-like domain
MKSEPDAYSIDDLEAEGKADWDGIRNYQARNFMRDDMCVGDQILFYHSNAKPPGVVGLAKVSRGCIPDYTAWDQDSKYYDPKSSPEKPIWEMVEIEFIEKFPRLVSLNELKEMPALSEMRLIKKGNRLSILPVEETEFQAIVAAATTS